MDNVISDKFGCQVIERSGRLFIRYDGGNIAVKMVEKEITAEEAKKAILSEEDAYQVIMSAIKREQNEPK
ncbi:hypothetical protein QWY31_00135 [Cytophagales bacterium LB-30]|uniref:Uncharacterized protein n=1 Tax=Shiella aurantiaca TaxID=3058365 RepID=A0ABT8F0A5_9BACT|nr:hypothetical protein [Shiella aurantiaca]MDN4163882.1 hypothetical protein [Shiella aurantiaca]